ncbi:MAG: 6-phosphogluconolactonase [Spirochaetaceae bacterium 4572_59]|nr:MAG: 6-phosphogluconolactonase [Spirochaetaceae bacterium 4572_59]
MAGALIFSTYEDFCRQAGEHIITILKAASIHKRRSSLVLAGGSTPAGVYRYMATNYPDFHWGNIDFFLGDDRCVPETDKNSNYRMINENLFSLIPHHAEQIYTIDQSLPPEKGAELYHKRVKNYLSTNCWFDLVLLGMGSDGHTASLFPGYPELDEKVKYAVATEIEAPMAPYLRRISMTEPALKRCSHMMYLIRGEKKRGIMDSVMKEKSHHHSALNYPIAHIKPDAGKSYWYYTV